MSVEFFGHCGTLIQLGAPFPRGTPQSEFSLSIGMLPVTLVFTSELAAEDIVAFHSGKVQFSFYQPQKEVVAFMAKIIGYCGWCDAIYAPCMDLFEVTEKLPTTRTGGHYPVNMVLVDKVSGLVAGLRTVSVTAAFAYRLFKAVNNAIDKYITYQDYASTANEVFERFTTKQLVKKANHIERAGVTYTG